MSGLSSSAWFTGDDGPADPPSERPAPPVAAPVSARTLPVTPAERACAAVLRAWLDWPGRGSDKTRPTMLMVAIHEALYRYRMISPGEITPAGTALLARVEAAERTPAADLGACIGCGAPATSRTSFDGGPVVPVCDDCPPGVVVDHQPTYAAGTTPIDASPAKEPR